MVLLKTHLIIYSKNDKQNSSKSVQSFYKIGILKIFAKFIRKQLFWSLHFQYICRSSACNLI